MKNLNYYGVKELNTNKIKETSGGDFGITLGLIALGLAILDTDWDVVGDDLSRGWNSYN